MDPCDEITNLLRRPMARHERREIMEEITEQFCTNCGGVCDIEAKRKDRCTCVIWADE